VENQKQVSHFPTAPILFLSKPKATTGFPTTERGGKNSCRQTEKILDAEQQCRDGMVGDKPIAGSLD
jgi:hypothetical protein